MHHDGKEYYYIKHVSCNNNKNTSSSCLSTYDQDGLQALKCNFLCFYGVLPSRSRRLVLNPSEVAIIVLRTLLAQHIVLSRALIMILQEDPYQCVLKIKEKYDMRASVCLVVEMALIIAFFIDL